MTNIQPIIHNIMSSLTVLPKIGCDELTANAGEISFPANQLLISAGKKPEYLYLVVNGLLRAVYETEQGNVCSKEFYWENDIIFSMRSIIRDDPLPYSIYSVEDCRLIKIPLSSYLQLIKKYSEWKDYHIAQLNFYLHAKEVKEEMLLVNNSQEKVVKAYELFPDFVKRVPATLLASYLNLTPVSLSRIKKRLNLK
ncbi:MAG: Crp/Fnr family transcriptional regulator [Kangiellaceae bacterium]|nr:Crp/Fnr family transcriptional regulator [Kangiellaceae bacterium]MCW9000907.1 Crp/Fnr family transcriptional regulator [Kangiellaceae bacterium]MCW9018344.1 Crp/Fnr family transcriptional regulator [Kangiellaceae bacterium]